MTNGAGGRCAVVANPVKVSDGFREAVTDGAARAAAGPSRCGWRPQRTTPVGRWRPRPSPSRSTWSSRPAATAPYGWSPTAWPAPGSRWASCPEGTANLLSRNLGIPQAETEAIEVALTGRTRTIDLVKLSVDGNDGRALRGDGGDGHRRDDHGRDRPGAEGQDRRRCVLRGRREGAGPAAGADADQGGRPSRPPPPGDDLRGRQRQHAGGQPRADPRAPSPTTVCWTSMSPRRTGSPSGSGCSCG